MNYLSAFLWPKLKEGRILLIPANNLKFIELPSVFIELCLYETQCTQELLLLWNLP